jgi:aspartokinase/homoserine dehydrogenase 1
LSGIDVARKILILIRESGYEMEIETLKTNLSSLVLETTNNADFSNLLCEHATHFSDFG